MDSQRASLPGSLLNQTAQMPSLMSRSTTSWAPGQSDTTFDYSFLSRSWGRWKHECERASFLRLV